MRQHIGKRVKVIKQTDRCINIVGQPVALWCAGRVPVGSTGTIVVYSDTMDQIVWDHGQKPKDGYIFGFVSFKHCGLELLKG